MPEKKSRICEDHELWNHEMRGLFTAYLLTILKALDKNGQRLFAQAIPPMIIKAQTAVQISAILIALLCTEWPQLWGLQLILFF